MTVLPQNFRFLIFLLALWACIACASCSSLPAILPDESLNTAPPECPGLYPQKKIRFVHSIEAVMPTGQTAWVIGVSAVNPESGEIHSLIMSLEGLIVFEAVSAGGTVSVKRAVSPFDIEGFAEGMMRDIRLIFFRPEAVPDERGFTGGGNPICRYRNFTGDPYLTLDLIGRRDSGWQAVEYKDGSVRKTVDFTFKKGVDFPQSIRLEGRGAFGYSLILNLIEYMDN